MCFNCCNRQSTLNNTRQGNNTCPYCVNPLYCNVIAGNQGPRGPQGIPGQSDAIYAIGNGTIASQALAPLILSVATPNATPTVANNSINLPVGYYLVSYSVSGTSTDTIDTALQLNGSTISTLTSTGAGSIDTSKTLLVQATTPSTLTLINEGTASITDANVGVTVVKVA